MAEVGQVFAVSDMTVLFTAVRAEHSDISGFCGSDHFALPSFLARGRRKKKKEKKKEERGGKPEQSMH